MFAMVGMFSLNGAYGVNSIPMPHIAITTDIETRYGYCFYLNALSITCLIIVGILCVAIAVSEKDDTDKMQEPAQTAHTTNRAKSIKTSDREQSNKNQQLMSFKVLELLKKRSIGYDNNDGEDNPGYINDDSNMQSSMSGSTEIVHMDDISLAESKGKTMYEKGGNSISGNDKEDISEVKVVTEIDSKGKHTHNTKANAISSKKKSHTHHDKAKDTHEVKGILEMESKITKPMTNSISSNKKAHRHSDKHKYIPDVKIITTRDSHHISTNM